MTATEKINALERETQNRIIKLFRERLNYRYIGNLQYEDNKNIREHDLRAWLTKQGYNDTLITKSIRAIANASAMGGGRHLYDANKDVYRLLRYGIKEKADISENNQTIWLIDWKNIHNNDFAIAEEVSIKGEHKKRPDIVLYVNGIALGVLELKRSAVDVIEGIRQNLDNQKKEFIRAFFTTIQLVMAGNNTQGLYYGTTETSEKYYLKWKNEQIDPLAEGLEKDLDKSLVYLCQKSRFLQIVHDFIVYDAGIKKTCRHNQYNGITKAIEHIHDRKGGIIWHTQGSGKSLTMVWLAKWIKENIENSRVLIITDRKELDEQIETVFTGVEETIYKCKSGADLIHQLNQAQPALICSLVHKFGRNGQNKADDDDEAVNEEYIEALKNVAGQDFHPKGNIFVFVDECHRTQSGKLHDAMKAILPNALFIGFTGTPLLKADKKKSIEVFGGFIHTYKFNEAVADGVVLDLRYEARNIEQYLKSPKKFDEWFDIKTANMSDLAKRQIRERWATMQKIQSSTSRLSEIVEDICMDMEKNPTLKNGHGNAMLVCGSVYQACQCYELFCERGFKGKVAVVTSFTPTIDKIKGEGNLQTEQVFKYDIYRKMLADYFETTEEQALKKFDDFETSVKKRFIEEPGRMKLLIVVDKLLTGFDAPSATYLYIDKKMADHNLFQAICRVNRLDGEDKKYGYIIDYQDLFKSLEKSISDYTSEAFADYEKEDVDGLIKDYLKEGKIDLDVARETVKALCEKVQPKDENGYVRYFCGTGDEHLLPEKQALRLQFYHAVESFKRAYEAIQTELEKAGYSKEEIKTIQEELQYHIQLRDVIRLAGADALDFKEIDADMRVLMNRHVLAHEKEVLAEFGDWSFLDLVINDDLDSLPDNIKNNPDLMAEMITNNVRRAIVDENPVNPKYYEKMSVLLEELIEQHNRKAIEYKEFLKEMIELAKKVKKPNTKDYPANIDTQGKQAIFDNFAEDASWVVKVHNQIMTKKRDEWVGNRMKERELLKYLRDVLEQKNVNGQEFIDLIKRQGEYQ